VWQLSSLMRPYPRLTASPSPPQPLTLVAPRGGSDTATIYLPASSESPDSEGELVPFAFPNIPGVEITLEATRCLDIEWLVDPDGAIGLTPEILIPVDEGQALEPPPEGQGYLLTARVSRDAAPGVVSGDLQISDLRIPVEIEIVNWEVPARPSLRTAFELSAWNLADQSPENLRRWMEVFAENRIGVALMTPPKVEVTDDGVEIDWSRFDAAARVAIDELGMTAFFTPPGLMGFQADRIDHWGLGHGTRHWEEAWRDYLPQLEAHLDANGWLDEAVFDLWDEPTATIERVAVCEEVGELARMVREHAPRLPQYVSTTEVIPQLEASWPEDLQGAVNMAILRQAPLEAIESRPRWFTLDSMVRTWITTSLDAPRATPLVAWAFGLEGMELWSVNAWNDERQREPGRLDPIDPRSLEPLGPLGAAEMGGILLYQDPVGRPLRSLTWVALGQGMEDVEILEALRAVEPWRAEGIAQEIRTATRAGECPLSSDWPELRREMLRLLAE
jgi:Glycoside hydrolase 123, catalytic domain